MKVKVKTLPSGTLFAQAVVFGKREKYLINGGGKLHEGTVPFLLRLIVISLNRRLEHELSICDDLKENQKAILLHDKRVAKISAGNSVKVVFDN